MLPASRFPYDGSMTTATVTVRLDPELLAAAADQLGIDGADMTPGALAAAVLRKAAGQRHLAAADGGRAPKRAGREWERAIVAYANETAGTTWDHGPLRGRRDLLDVTGCIPGGWLVGAKSKERGVSPFRKISEAMDQGARALEHLPEAARALGFGAPAHDVIPWQILQRPGAPVGRAYAVTEFDHMLTLVRLRRDWDGAAL